MLLLFVFSAVQSVRAVQPKVSGGAYHGLFFENRSGLGITVKVAVKSPDRQRN